MPTTVESTLGMPSAEAILNSVRHPLLVLDSALRVRTANRIFYETFNVDPEHTQGRLLFDINDSQWDVPALRGKLETIIPGNTAIDDFEIEHTSPLGPRSILLSAHQSLYDQNHDPTIQLNFRDVTIARTIDREKDELLRQTAELLRQKEILLQEMQHRVVNSLQIIASILTLKMRGVTSEETRQELHDTRQRVISIAEVQRRFCVIEGNVKVVVGSYLTNLCASLAASMIAAGQPITVRVVATDGAIKSDQAVSLGLIVTELLINAIKYAFPTSKPDGQILVTYEADESDWKLIVSDNGIGKSDAVDAHVGLGSIIIAALVQQLDAKLEIIGGTSGTTASITHATFTSHMPRAGWDLKVH